MSLWWNEYLQPKGNSIRMLDQFTTRGQQMIECLKDSNNIRLLTNILLHMMLQHARLFLGNLQENCTILYLGLWQLTHHSDSNLGAVESEWVWLKFKSPQLLSEHGEFGHHFLSNGKVWAMARWDSIALMFFLEWLWDWSDFKLISE